MNKDPYFGVIGIDARDTDYQLGADVEVARASHKYQDNEIQYNQNEVSTVSCTIHGAMGAVSDLTGYVFTLEDRKALWAQALELGADTKVGWYTSRAVDLVRKFYNEKFPAKTLTSFRTGIGGAEHGKMLRLGYTAVISHRGNSQYNSDKNADGILDGVSFGSTTYGHCLREAYSPGDPYDLYINNYKGANKHNVYRVPSANTAKLVANRILFSDCYFFVEAYEDKTPDVPIWAKASYEKALAKGYITADTDIFAVVADPVAEDLLVKTGTLSKAEGNLTLIRLIVALDRLNRLD